jgi:hypothetical protein
MRTPTPLRKRKFATWSWIDAFLAPIRKTAPLGERIHAQKIHQTVSTSLANRE